MTDFGIGVASAVLLEVVKGINDYRKEIKINKQQAQLLTSKVEDIASHLDKLVIQAVNNGLKPGDSAHTVIEGFSTEFHKMLIIIKDRMKEWSNMSWLSRAWPGTKGVMEDEISKLNGELVDEWKKFQDQLAVYNIVLSAQLIIQIDKAESSFKDARVEDAKKDAILFKESAETLKLLQTNAQNMEQLLSMEISTNEAINRLEAKSTVVEDPAIIEAREQLTDALRSYEGPSPPIGIDSSELTLPFATPHHTGQYSVIHKGYRNGQLVAIKQLRISDPDDLDVVYRRIQHEAEIWSQLSHPNIVKFLGCYKPKDELVHMVSTWVEHEDIRKYLKKYRDADRLKLTLDIAHGLKYLHDHQPYPIIHASLQGSHVLVDSDGVARLNDFGISFIANQKYPGSRPPPVKWSSPEQLKGGEPATASDIYSFALTFIEILTSADPFNEYKIRNPHELQRRVSDGLRPRFPGPKYANRGLPSLDCPLWEMLVKCWDGDPKSRPSIENVIEVLTAVKGTTL